jgi:hypothetical protein
MKRWISLLLLTLLVFPGFAKSKSYATNRGYSHVGGSHGNYIPGREEKRLERYLYSAFQHGYVEGNLRTNHKYAKFNWEPYLGVSSLVMTDPGHSTLDLYFKQDRKYHLESANLSILEKISGYQVGSVTIEVNGRNIISHHSARYNHRFEESSWGITQFCKEGLNHISIQLDSNGGYVALLGAKVETRERRKSGGSDHKSNERFVKRTFRKIHHRHPTVNELDRYTHLLDFGTKSRAEVAEMIRDLSGDPGDQFDEIVDDYFMRYARRYPTADERDYYANKLRRNQMTLPQLREICKGLEGTGGDSSIETRLKKLFREILQREPSHTELDYYTRKIRMGELTWEQARHEIIMLIEDGMGGQGISRNEIRSFQFTRYELTPQFWNRLERTSSGLLQEFLQRANHMQIYGTNNEVKTIAGRVYRRIKTIQMNRG